MRDTTNFFIESSSPVIRKLTPETFKIGFFCDGWWLRRSRKNAAGWPMLAVLSRREAAM
jgi:hypothetical protein